MVNSRKIHIIMRYEHHRAVHNNSRIIEFMVNMYFNRDFFKNLKRFGVFAIRVMD